MTAKDILQLVSQVGFPIVFILALVYYVGKFGIPKAVALIEGMIKDFREEMEKERRAHAENLNRFFDNEGRHHSETSQQMTKEADRVIEVVKDKCGPSGPKSG